MEILKISLYVYLGIGFVYALYIWLFAGDPWYSIPLNILGGPINIIYQTIRAIRQKTVEAYDIFKGKKAVIFDMDGTIIDSQPFHNKAVEDILKQIDADWVTREYDHGLNDDDKWRDILNRNKDIKTPLSIKELATRSKARYLELHKDVEALDGFWILAKYLKEKGFKMALVTNTDRDVTDEVLRRLGAEKVFDLIIAGDEVKKRKPDPEIYVKAMRVLGVRPKDIVAFEDTIVGSTASTQAKIPTIIIWDGVDETQENFPKNTYLFIPNFDGLPEFIEKPVKKQLEEAAKELEAEGVGPTPEE